MSPEAFCKSETAAQCLWDHDYYHLFNPRSTPGEARLPIWTPFTLILLHSIFDPYLAQLMVVRTASMSCLRPNLFQHTWKQTCDPEVTGGQAVLLLLSATLGEKAEQEHVSSLNSSASYIYIIASCSDYQARALITCRLTVSTSGVHDNSSSGHFSVPSSASRQLPRMHLSSWRSDLATSSCSRTDWSHCWRRWAI